MTSIPLPLVSDGIVDLARDHPTIIVSYELLATRILETLERGEGLMVVIGEPLPSSFSLRRAIESLDGQIHALEVRCGFLQNCAQVIANLAQFATAAGCGHAPADGPEAAAEAWPPAGHHPRAVFICDDINQLAEDQLEKIHRVVCGSEHCVAAVLIASPEFLLRLDQRRRHLVQEAALVFRLDHPRYEPARSRSDFSSPDSAVVQLSQGTSALPCPTMVIDVSGRDSTERPSRSGMSSLAAMWGAVAESHPWRGEGTARRVSIAGFFCVAYVLGELAIIYAGWRLPLAGDKIVALDSGHVQATVPEAPPVAAAPHVSETAAKAPRGTEGSGMVAASATDIRRASLPATPAEKSSIANSSTSPTVSAVAPQSIPTTPREQSSIANLLARARVSAVEPPGIAATLGEKSSTADSSTRPSGPALGPDSIPATPAEKSSISNLATPPIVSPVAPASIPTTPSEKSSIPNSATPARVSATEIAALLQRGEGFLAAGDIASARLFYERAATGGSAQAAFRIGETFDPSFLSAVGARGVQGDRSQADLWYRRARQLSAAPPPSTKVSGKDNQGD